MPYNNIIDHQKEKKDKAIILCHHLFTCHQALVVEWEGASLLPVGTENFLELLCFDDLQRISRWVVNGDTPMLKLIIEKCEVTTIGAGIL